MDREDGDNKAGMRRRLTGRDARGRRRRPGPWVASFDAREHYFLRGTIQSDSSEVDGKVLVHGGRPTSPGVPGSASEI